VTQFENIGVYIGKVSILKLVKRDILMAGVKRYSPTATLVSKTAISQASSTLMDLPEKPQEIWSLREAINELQDQILLALKRGYDYPEIAEMLTQQGVEISASTLKYYLSSVRRTENGKHRKVTGKVTKKTLTKATAAVEDATSETIVQKVRDRKPKTDKVVTSKATKTTKAPKTAAKVAKVAKATAKTAAKTTKAAIVKTTTKTVPQAPADRGRRKATSA
jgi:hypothetical protein